MLTPDKHAPSLIVCGGPAADALADALAGHLAEAASGLSPHPVTDADYAAQGLRVATAYAARLTDLADRQDPALADALTAELARLGLPEAREAADPLAAAGDGTLVVLCLDGAASPRPQFRHRTEDWLLDIAPEGLDPATFLHMEEPALRAAMADGTVRVAPEHRDHVAAVREHLARAYELTQPETGPGLALDLRALAERLPQGAKLVVLLPEAAGMAEGLAPLSQEYPFVAVLDGLKQPQADAAEPWQALAARILDAARILPGRAGAPLSRRRAQRLMAERRARAASAAQAADFAKAGFEALLRAEPPAETVAAIARALAEGQTSFAQHLRALAASEDFAAAWVAKPPAGVPAPAAVPAAEAAPAEPAKTPITTFVDQRTLRTPQELAVTPLVPKRVLIVGSCLSAGLARRMEMLRQPVKSDLFFAGTPLPASPPAPFAEYDFQLVQLTLRTILPDNAFARLAQSDEAEHEKLFTRVCAMMARQFDLAMRWNKEHGLLTFVMPFLPPTQNLVGRLMPRFDLRNAVYFIERLNQALGEQIARCANAFYLDINEINGFYGRRYVQDDILQQFNHNAFIGNFDSKHDHGRLEPPGRATDFFVERAGENFAAFWNEVVGLYRTIRQIDQIKMVAVDLDDTMWRGVLGEQDLQNLPSSEGWPKGLWEALLILKRRGVMLAIVSKNDEQRIMDAWDAVFRKHLHPSDFVAREINWSPKPENLRKILDAVNILPRNVLYIDDNPVERAGMQSAFPELRVLGGSPLLWRRILLWAPETQVAAITAESSARTDMVRAQIAREEDRKALSRDEFLASLGVSMAITEISSTEFARFPRALELINKTNQFNTTGKRWTLEECKAHFAAGHTMLSFEVADQYTDYGLVGVLILRGGAIAQFVMSCRVIGLGIETAAVALAGDALMRHGAQEIFADMIETDRNQPCRDVYAQCGFTRVERGWTRPAENWVTVPAHIEVKIEAAGPAKQKVA